jgi:hypothetical protein
MSQLGAYLGLAYALGHLPATVTSVGLLAQVPLTALLAVPLLGEPLTTPYLAGGSLVLAGIYVVNSGRSEVRLKPDTSARSCLINLTLVTRCERAWRASHATGARRRRGARERV